MAADLAPSPSVHAFWADFLAVADGDASARFYESFHFGDSESLADELAALVHVGASAPRPACCGPSRPRASRCRGPVTRASSKDGPASRFASSRLRPSRWCRSPRSVPSSLRPREKTTARSNPGAAGTGPTSAASVRGSGGSRTLACRWFASPSASSSADPALRLDGSIAPWRRIRPATRIEPKPQDSGSPEQ